VSGATFGELGISHQLNFVHPPIFNLRRAKRRSPRERGGEEGRGFGETERPPTTTTTTAEKGVKEFPPPSMSSEDRCSYIDLYIYIKLEKKNGIK
jgi:hypothetical protein